MRDYLFLAGEYHVTMPAVFTLDNWMHTMTAKKLVFSNNKLFREEVQGQSNSVENLKGLIFLADVLDKDLEESNLRTIIKSKVKCWPDPELLLRLSNRFLVLEECVKAGFVTHKVEFVAEGEEISLKTPFVIKTSRQHRGADKFLINNLESLPKFSYASVEPFFEGESVRILFIGKKYFFYKIENKDSWIKNSLGGEIIMLNNNDCPISLARHAFKVKEHFNLEICGIDYILNKDKFHFLEINQFPGLNPSDEVCETARKFLIKKMKEVELGQ